MARGVAITLDARTGALLVEDTQGLPSELRETLELLAGPPQAIACATPPAVRTLGPASAEELASEPCVRLAGYWHDSLIEGPGRRSVAKLQGCPLRCRGCITPDSWDAASGHSVPVGRLADALLDSRYSRDGVSILGGEPFAQPAGLLALVRGLRKRGCRDILAYSGFTYERLRHMAEHQPAIKAVLDDIEMQIDGPYVAALADTGGPWTGSGNQHVIDLVATRRCGHLVTRGS